MTTTPEIKRSPETVAAIELLTDLAKGFTAHHRDLQVHGADASSSKTILAIRSHPWDYPKLVGAKGKHHRAIQTIFSTVGQRVGREIEFTLLPVERRDKQPEQYLPNDDWDPRPMHSLLERTLAMAFGAEACLLFVRHDSQELSTFMVETCETAILGNVEFHLALYAIFHAIGKNQGRLVHVEFVQPKA